MALNLILQTSPKITASLALLLLALVACSPSPSAPLSTATPAPSPTPIVGSLIGRPVTSGTKQVYRVMEDGTLRHIPDTLTLTALAYDVHDIVTITSDRLTSYPLAMPLSRWLTGHTDHDLYYLQRGKRYPITESQLTLTSGTPAEVALVDDGYLNSFPLATAPFEGSDLPAFSMPQAAPPATDVDRRSGQGTDHWFADANYYDFTAHQYHIGRGLILRRADGTEQAFNRDPGPNDPFKSITTLAVDPKQERLWVGTRFIGLLSLDLNGFYGNGLDNSVERWSTVTQFNAQLGDNHINRLWISADNTIWAAAPAGMLRFDGQRWHTFTVPDDITDSGVLAFAVGSDNSVWAAGNNFVAHVTTDGKWTVYSAFEHPRFLDRFHEVQLNARGEVTFIGDTTTITRDANGWQGFDPAKPDFASGPNFPTPDQDYQGWLKAWPRPTNDNGRGMHYLAYPSNDLFELRVNLERLKRLKVRWLLVNYTNRAQLPLMAPVFKAAGIMVIWRPFVRPYREYPYWAKDVAFLRGMGLPPYLQIYNEPSLGQEWEDDHRQIDQQLYLKHLFPAMREVYEAGGYVGLQQIDMDWLRTILQQMKTQGDSDIFPRMFFIPHAYGYNHPPEFDLDANSVLGFRDFAEIFKTEIGYIPMMVAGEGGWRPGEAQDIRYPMVTQSRHRDYLVEVFRWFQSGKLSNGEPLPDYFSAFCVWILSDPTDPAAWYDSPAGNRDLLIQAVIALPSFTRHFSFD